LSSSLSTESYATQFPNIDLFLHRPLLSNPPLCSLKDLKDGSIYILDVLIMHQLLDLKNKMKEDTKQPEQEY